MAEKSASSPNNIISLPKGGGALSGLGDKFSPDLFTGTGNYTVPIALPKGRNGFEPKLNLSYSTGSGNGIFGLGWSISIPAITRKTSQGIPLYTNNDVFIISGAEDLVEIKKENNKTYYRPRTEGLFAKIIRIKDYNNDYWEVFSKDGLKSYYGKPKAVISNPDYPSNIFSWKLTKTVDTFGNIIEYNYEKDTIGNQLYLKEIKYIDYIEGNNEKFLVSVVIDYKEDNNKEERPDPFSEFRSSFEIRTSKRCRKISIYLHEDEDKLIKYYELKYIQDKLNNISLLTDIRMIGVDGQKTEGMPKLSFSYSDFDINKRNLIAIEGKSLPALTLARPEYELVDLFGTGLPDILEMSTNTVRYWRNLGEGKFALPRNMESAPAGVKLGDKDVQLIDSDGDGKTDLMINNANGLSGYYPLRFNGTWDTKSFKKYKYKPTFDFKDLDTRLIDLTGDGVTDALKTSSRFECYFNDKQQGWKEMKLVQRKDAQYFPNIIFSDNRVKVGDMSGDGLLDIILIHNGSVEYWPNLGYGNWGKRIHMTNSPKFPYEYDVKRVLIGDLDGDGLSDIVYVEDKKVTLWINQGGNSWSNPSTILGTPSVADLDSIRIVDLLGNGVGGILWSLENKFSLRSNMYFLDFIGGRKPYLINEINNNMGSMTKITYAPSTKYYLKDEKKKQTRWKTPLPFPVQVVEKVEVIDEISVGKLSTEYSYHHGYWDGAEREFRGFGRVDHRDTEIIQGEYFSPPLETRTWFHQGPIGDEFGEWKETDYSNEFWIEDKMVLKRSQEMVDLLKRLPTRKGRRDALRTLRGMIIRSEVYALDGSECQDRPYTVTESLNGVLEVPLYEENPVKDKFEKNIFFSISLAQRTTQWERGNEPMTQFVFTDKYDNYGQILSKVNVGVSREESEIGKYLITMEEYKYASSTNTSKYIVDRKCSSTSFEIINDGTFRTDNKDNDIFTMYTNLYNKITNSTINKKVFQKVVSFYDGEEFIGEEFGKVGNYGALVKSETLVLTSEILKEVYKDVNPVDKMPPYFIDDNENLSLWDEYTKEFKDTLPPLAGYIHHNEGDNFNYAEGFYTLSTRIKYDFHENINGVGRGLIKVTEDPLNNNTLIKYDDYELMPTEVEDAIGLKTKAKYDYRVMQPLKVIDANDNRQLFTFTPLGLLKEIFVLGKEGEQVGDIEPSTDDNGIPSVTIEYNFLAFELEKTQPIYVSTVQRVYHASDNISNEVIKTIEFSDGFGRMVQKRVQGGEVIFIGNGDITFGDVGLPKDQGESVTNAVAIKNDDVNNPYVVVSGWQVYDNKGRVVEKYEPFFDLGWNYKKPSLNQYGEKIIMYYDPRGTLIKTINPDNSQQTIILGVPYDITNPESFNPTPWEQYFYDSNDNAGRTHGGVETGYESHFNTPTSILLDCLGRKIESVERHGQGEDELYKILYKYDIRGSVIEVKDQLNRIAGTTIYDFNKSPLKVYMADAGIKISILNSSNKIIEQRDSKEALILYNYDQLQRNIKIWARNNKQDELTLKIKNIYEDNIDRTVAKTSNLLGMLFKQYDEAGIVIFEKYDFKGNVLEKIRKVINDNTIINAVKNKKYLNLDWNKEQTIEFEENDFRTSFSYDVLNRISLLTYPETTNEQNKIRRKLKIVYNRAGILEKVYLDDKTYVDFISYNPKGDRVLISYGNGIMTRYYYDDKTFRLSRLRTERYKKVSDYIYEPKAQEGLFQDYSYKYDLIGNILKINDVTPNSGTYLSENTLEKTFTYDPLYRLLSATGREYVPPTSPIPYIDTPWYDRPTNSIINGDLSNIIGYSEVYSYDKLDNLLSLTHNSYRNNYSRLYTIAGNNSKLNTLKINNNIEYIYNYDPSGNLTKENCSRRFTWDYMNRLISFIIQGNESESSISQESYYLYTASGERVKKVTISQSGLSRSTVYIDGIFEQETFKEFQQSGNEMHTNYTIHIMDNEKNIALERRGRLPQEDKEPLIQYQISDKLGSINVVLNDTGQLIDREEYTPYGESTLRTLKFKRYRFSGKEKDNESGLYYFGARYYAPWLGRWISTDPIGIKDGLNVFAYGKNNPVTLIDKKGTQTSQPNNTLTNVITENINLKGTQINLQTTDVTNSAQNKSDFINIISKEYNKTQLIKLGLHSVVMGRNWDEILNNVNNLTLNDKNVINYYKNQERRTGKKVCGFFAGDSVFIITSGSRDEIKATIIHETGHVVKYTRGFSFREIVSKVQHLEDFNGCFKVFNDREKNILNEIKAHINETKDRNFYKISQRTDEINQRLHEQVLKPGGREFISLFFTKRFLKLEKY